MMDRTMTGGSVGGARWGSAARAIREVEFAFENQPMWADHMAAAGLRPVDIRSEEDIRRIPLTQKADYRRGFPAGVLIRGTSVNDRLVLKSQSSGTGGERLVTVAHTYALAERMSATMTIHPGLRERFLEFRHQRPARYAAPNCSDIECASPHTTLQDRILPDGTLVLPVAHDLLATSESMLDQAAQEIDDWRTDWLYTDPTHLSHLIRHCQGQNILAPATCRGLALTYTACTQTARRQIDGYFDASVPRAEIVSMSELGWLAMECPNGQLHLNSSTFYLELIADNEAPLAETMEELVVTSLGDRLCPHIRYRTGDMYTVLGDCTCGHPFPAVRHEGRRRDMIVRDTKIVLTPKQLDELIGGDCVDLYKLEQLTEDTFDFRYIPADHPQHDCESHLRSVLVDSLRPGHINIEATHYIPCERSGKFLSCVSAVSQRLVL